jgi:hypothetical protein
MNTLCERTKQVETDVSHDTVSHQLLLQTKELHQLQLIVQRQIWDRERAALEGEVKKLREQACCWAAQVACLEAEVSHLSSSLNRNMSSEANNCELERSSGAGVWRLSDSRARTAKTGHEEMEMEGSMSISPISRSSSSTDNDVCHPATSPGGPINPVAGLRQRLSSAEQVYKRLQRAGLRQRWYVMCGSGAGGDRMRLCGYVCYVCARKHTLC